MKIVPLNKITPFKYYIKHLDARHIYPFDIVNIKNMTYCMAAEHCYFQYTVCGQSEIITNGKKIITRPGTLLYVPAWQTPVTYSESHDYEYTRAEFLLADVTTHEPIIPFDNLHIIFKKTPPSIKNNIQTLVDKMPFVSENEELSATKELFDLFCNIIETKYPPEHADVNTNIKAVINHIQTNRFKHETVTDYAKIAGLSEQYFRTLFKKETGMSPIEFRNYQRIEYAKILLCDSIYTNEYVSTYIGFDDPNYFARLFKKLTGYTPQSYKHKFSTPHYFETHSRKQYKKEHPGDKI